MVYYLLCCTRIPSPKWLAGTPAAAAAGKDSFTHDFEIADADIKLTIYER